MLFALSEIVMTRVGFENIQRRYGCKELMNLIDIIRFMRKLFCRCTLSEKFRYNITGICMTVLAHVLKKVCHFIL